MKCRPRQLLQDLGIRYNWIFEIIETFRDEKKNDWPDWCYIPTSAVKAIIKNSPQKTNDLSRDTGMVAFLATWRATKGIYRFDPDVYNEVRKTPVKGNIPWEVLYQLPEWCIYIETPGMSSAGGEVFGAFVFMDSSSTHDTLNVLLDAERGLFPLAIKTSEMTLDAAMADFMKVYEGMSLEREIQTFTKIISLLVYLCSSTVDYVEAPKKLKKRKGKKEWITPRVTNYDVGIKMGTALRHYRQLVKHKSRPSLEHEKMAPHIRRAHYHHFWKGPMDERELIVKWLPPIPINVDGDLPVTIRAVKA